MSTNSQSPQITVMSQRLMETAGLFSAARVLRLVESALQPVTSLLDRQIDERFHRQAAVVGKQGFKNRRAFHFQACGEVRIAAAVDRAFGTAYCQRGEARDLRGDLPG